MSVSPPSNGNVFLWKISRFSLYTQNSKEYVSSAIYHSTNLYQTEWELQLSVGDPENGSPIGVYLKRCNSESDRGPSDLFLHMEVCIIDDDLQKHFVHDLKCNFRKDAMRGFDNLVERKEVIKNRKTFLPKDKLTLQCCLKKCALGMIQPQISTYNMDFEVEQLDFSWSISWFNEREPHAKRNIYLLSDVAVNGFELSGDFEMQIPTEKDVIPKYAFRIYIKPVTGFDKRVFISAKISVLDNLDKPCKVMQGNHFFEADSRIAWRFAYVPTHKLSDPTEHVLDLDFLNMKCEMTVMDAKQAKVAKESLAPLVQKLKNEEKTVQKDIQPLFETGMFPDMQLKLGIELFPAHRLILGARSSVFREALKRAEDKRKGNGMPQIIDSRQSSESDSDLVQEMVDSRKNRLELPLLDSETDSDRVEEVDKENSCWALRIRSSESGSGNVREDVDKGGNSRALTIYELESDSYREEFGKSKNRPVLPLIDDSDSEVVQVNPDDKNEYLMQLMDDSKSSSGEMKIAKLPSSSRSSNESDNDPNNAEVGLISHTPQIESSESGYQRTYLGAFQYGGIETVKIEPVPSDSDVLERNDDFKISLKDGVYVAEIFEIGRRCLKQMLRCMYTDTLEDLSVDSAVELYRAGVKYQIESLVGKCESFFKSAIDLSNVYSLLFLGDSIPIESLKEAALLFVEINSELILYSEDWQTFLETHRDLGRYALRYLRERKCNR